MLDNANDSRTERRSALIVYELSCLDFDVAALSEVRFPVKGSFQENGAGLTLFWSGKPSTDRRHSSVGFIVRISIAFK